MKVLQPAVTCVLVSHMKPAYLPTALASIQAQTRRDFQVIVADSGQWIEGSSLDDQRMSVIHDQWAGHPLVEWVTTGEPPDLRYRRCPVAWTTNEVIRAGLVRGRYMCTFYDDDRYLPGFFEAMAGTLDAHPDLNAVYCSQQWVRIDASGNEDRHTVLLADQPRSEGMFDCQVDGGMVMWRTTMLDLIGDPWLPESPETCSHSDGLFLERLARVAGVIHPVAGGAILCENRKTPVSTYAPT